MSFQVSKKTSNFLVLRGSWAAAITYNRAMLLLICFRIKLKNVPKTNKNGPYRVIYTIISTS